jgi:tetratricopeptide (TPR) repeat protein
MIKMTKFILLFLSLTLSLQAFSNVEERRNKLLGIIDQELGEIVRLNKQVGSKNPTLLLRLAELYLEKARLLKERENQEFLTMAPEARQNVNKAKFFDNSNKHFQNAQKTCYYILKRFPQFKGKSDVYYILAYNAKEFQQESKAGQFFARAVKIARKGSDTSIKSKLALAEMHYNRKEYAKAIPLYQESLAKKNQRWWTKDAYNLAWCYFRVGDKQKAINLLNEVHRLSGSPDYVDMRTDVERDLAFFYAESGRTQEAIAHYQKMGKDIGNNLIKVARYLNSQGKFTAAEKALLEAKKHATSEEDIIAINIELVALYERFGKQGDHLESTKSLSTFARNGKLSSEQIDILKYHAQKMSALLQKQVAGKSYASQKRVRRQKANWAVEYFEIFAELEPAKKAETLFLAGETMYADGQFDRAVVYYDKAYEIAREERNSKYAGLALEGMLAGLSGKGIKKATVDSYLTKAYKGYVATRPNSTKVHRIYQRLFSAYHDKKDIASCEAVLSEFKSRYPGDQKTQEAMLARIMDHYRGVGDKEAVKSWVARINSGEYRVSPNYLEKLKMVLLTMQFESVEKASSSGDKKLALKGYLQIFKSPQTSEDAKKNAAYNIAILFHELDEAKFTYGWSKRALELMSPSDVKKFDGSFLIMANSLYYRRMHKEASEINSLALKRICREKSRNKDIFYKNAVILALAENDVPGAVNATTDAKRCDVSDKQLIESQVEIIRTIVETKQWGLFGEVLNSLEGQKSASADLVYPLGMYSKAIAEAGRVEESRTMMKRALDHYRRAVSQKKNVPLEGLDIVAEQETAALEVLAARLKSGQLQFPEQNFNAGLKTKFSQLDALTSKAVNVLGIGSGKGIVKAYSVLIDSYDYLVQEIVGFTPPEKSADYIASFKKSMQEIAQPLSAKSNEFKAEVRKQIEKSEILSDDNANFLVKSLAGAPAPHHYPIRKGLIMDRGGQR